MSGQVSSIMEELIVFEQLLCRVVRLHTLRTDEALKRETQHQNQQIKSSENFNPASLLAEEKREK